MENEKQSFCSFWYTRFQGALFLLALLTSGLGDALTSSWMIEQQGLMREGNIFVRYIVSYYGASNFILIKVWLTFIILILPFIILFRPQQPAYWMINGYLASFIVAGTLAMMINIQAAANEALLLLPQHVVLIFISLVLILINIGEAIDRTNQPLIRGYFDCVLNDIMIILNLINNNQRKESPGALN